MLRRILGLLKDAAVYGIGGALSQLINFLLLPLYTRFLTPEDYGVMAMLAIVAALFEPIAQLGIRPAIFRFFTLAKTPEEQQEVLSTGAWSILVTSTLLLVITVAGAGPIGMAVGVSAVGLIRLTLVSSWLASLVAVPLAVMRASRQPTRVSAFTLLRLLSSIAASVFFVVGLEWGVLGAVVGTLVGEVITAVAIFTVTHRRFKLLVDWERWKTMFRWGAPYVPHHLQAVGVDFFGIYLVGTLLGNKEAGLYYIAVKLAIPLSFAVNTIQQAWVAYKFHIFKVEADPKPVFRSIATYYLATLAYLWVGISVWSPELLRLMMALQFHDAGPLISVVAAISIARGIFFMSQTGMELQENMNVVPLVSFAGLVTIVVAGFGLTTNLGAMGAALGSTLSWLVMAAMFFYFAYSRYPIPYDWTSIAGMLVAALAFVVVGHFTKGLLPVPRIAAGVALSLAYPAVALAILSRSRSERERIAYLLVRMRRLRSAQG